MPFYEYRCTKGHTFEVRQSMSDDPLKKCEVCGAKASRVLFAPAIHFKGTGLPQHRLLEQAAQRVG